MLALLTEPHVHLSFSLPDFGVKNELDAQPREPTHLVVVDGRGRAPVVTALIRIRDGACQPREGFFHRGVLDAHDAPHVKRALLRLVRCAVHVYLHEAVVICRRELRPVDTLVLVPRLLRRVLHDEKAAVEADLPTEALTRPLEALSGF